jgi:hypothetical protein
MPAPQPAQPAQPITVNAQAPIAAVIDALATGTQAANAPLAASVMRTDSQSDITAPPGAITVSERVGLNPGASVDECMYDLRGLGSASAIGLGSWLSRAVRAVKPILNTVVPGASAVTDTFWPDGTPKQPEQPMPVVQAVPVAPQVCVRRDTAKSLPAWVLPTVLVGGGLLVVGIIASRKG